MKSIIFDFDSTLIKEESLELILKPILAKDSNKLSQIEKITDLGMQGQLDFRESLEQRLAIATPTKKNIDVFLEKYCPTLLTDGMLELVETLKKANYDIFIFSGGLKESIVPFAKHLGIKEANIFAVEVVWDQQGNFKSLDNSNGACDSKLEAFKKIKHLFTDNVIAVGDGYTDYQLYESAFADKFIAYTEHIARANVIDKTKFIASNVCQLRDLIFSY